MIGLMLTGCRTFRNNERIVPHDDIKISIDKVPEEIKIDNEHINVKPAISIDCMFFPEHCVEPVDITGMSVEELQAHLEQTEADTKLSDMDDAAGGVDVDADYAYSADTSAGKSTKVLWADMVEAYFTTLSISEAEFGRLNGGTEDIQAALDARCLEAVFGTSIGTGMLLDGAVLKTSAILQKYHGVDPSANTLTALGSATFAAWRTNLGLVIGTDVLAPNGTGSSLTAVVQSSGDCASGACGDGTSDGGTYYRLYDGSDHYGELKAPSLAANATYTLPAATTTMIGTLLDELDRPSRTAAPGTPIDGALYHADNDTWDPATYAGTVDYWVVYDGASYIALWDDDGNWLIESLGEGIGIQSMTPMSDTPANFLGNFTGNYLKGGVFITTAAGTAVLPPVTVGMNFTVIVDAAELVNFNPDATGTEDTITIVTATLGYNKETQGEQIDNGSADGAMCVFQYLAADEWLAVCTDDWTGE